MVFYGIVIKVINGLSIIITEYPLQDAWLWLLRQNHSVHDSCELNQYLMKKTTQ